MEKNYKVYGFLIISTSPWHIYFYNLHLCGDAIEKGP